MKCKRSKSSLPNVNEPSEEGKPSQQMFGKVLARLTQCRVCKRRRMETIMGLQNPNKPKKWSSVALTLSEESITIHYQLLKFFTHPTVQTLRSTASYLPKNGNQPPAN